MEITKVVKPFIRRWFVIYINFMIYIFVNIYLQILKNIKNLYFCQSLKFVVVWCLLNCLLLLIMLHKCLSLSLCVCVCVLCLPLHIVMHLFSVHFICQIKKKSLHTDVTPVCVCVCVCVRESEHACSMLSLCFSFSPSCMEIFQIYVSFVDFICQFL